MSLAQEIKNYLEFIQTLPYLNNNFITSLPIFVKYNIVYIFQYLKDFIIYFFSGNWLFDFVHMPITIPNWVSSNLKEIYSLKNPNHFLYSYSSLFEPNQQIDIQNIIEGFFTSFFLYIPNSIIHFLLIRRLIVEGIIAGIAAASGTLVSQLLFLYLIFSGSRFIIFTWFNLEPLTYISGIVFILFLVYNLTHTPIKRIRKNDISKLATIFFINFGLVWTEQYGLLPYLSNLNINSGSTFFDFITIDDSYSMSLYFIGFLGGSILWIFIFGFIFLKISQFFAERIIKSYSQWIQKFNFFCLTTIIAYCLASLPYYGIDYLITFPLGFHSQDPVFEPVLLKTDIKDVSKGRLGEYSANSSIDTDVAPFDRGRYSTGSEIELTFEDMNFQGEYIWRSRSDRVSSGSAGVINRFMSKFLPSSSSISSTDTNIELNDLEEENMSFLLDPYSWFISNEHYETFLERFLTDYNAEVKDSSLSGTTDDSEYFSAFSELVKYGFDSFASLEEMESDEFEEELGKKIKYKYYNNPIYKFLLTIDLQNFLKRQPINHYLTVEEENLLFHKRLVLNNYYNTLRSYSLLPYSESFKNLFGGTKSYANRVYNQQYKGTLKILRRLFLIDISSEPLNESYLTSLKYDQPLFRDHHSQNNYSFHEELSFFNKDSNLKSNNLKEIYSIPFYIGWDQSKRQLILTNRLPLNKNLFNKIKYSSELKKSSKSININFTSWPLKSLIFENDDFFEETKSRLLFQKFNQSKSDSQKDLFEYAEPGDYETHLIYETLPSIVQRIDLRNKDKTFIKLKPLRGGFLWHPYNSKDV